MSRGTVVAAHGRQYEVELPDGSTLRCFTRGKKSDIACGDQVDIAPGGDAQGVIERIAERRSLLYRSNEFRQKLIAANVTQIVIVVATEPSFSDELITRCLVAAESQDINALIVLNKCDLEERTAPALAALAPFVALDYPVISLSARGDLTPLRERLAGQLSVLVGQSGMGKSTLTNALVPHANAATREISTALDSGKHTTTHATLYRLDADSALIDSPGLQEFGLSHLDATALEHAFPEIRTRIGECRFRNCRHDREPGCAIRDALETGAINARRYAVFRALRSHTR